jgi:nicotinamide-nucleotide amidase
MSAAIGPDSTELAERIAERAAEAGVAIATCESLTGGSIAATLAAAPGASRWFNGSIVAYSDTVKFGLLGVDRGPVVTATCASEMAHGAARLLEADFVVAVTGVGGPDPAEGQPPGTVYLAHGRATAVRVKRLEFEGEPDAVVDQTVRAALAALLDDLIAGGGTRG